MSELTLWRKRAPLAVAVASALFLAGCGGSGGGSAAPGTGDTGGDTGGTGGDTGNTGGGNTTAVSGKAADGYLNGATVCLDIDGNMKCDASEPTATTGAGGAFTLDVPASVDAAAYAIVVEVGAGTVDEDTGAAVGKPYVLSAPAGQSDFISPLTTAVHGILERNPSLTLDEAVSQVSLSIGASNDVSLFEDYVAAKQETDSATAEAYERLHRVAQVSAKVLAENHEAIMSAAAEQGIDADQVYGTLLMLVVEQVVSQLEGAAQAVDTAGDSFDVGAVSVTTSDAANLAQQIEAVESVASAATISIQTLMTQGVYWMYAAGGEYEYGKLEAGSEPGRLQEQWHAYDGISSVWEEGTLGDDIPFFLGASGWAQVADVAQNYAATYQTDGSAILALDGADFALKFSATEVDVSGRAIKTYLGYPMHEPFAAAIAGDPVFSADAKVYQVNFIATKDVYSIGTWFDCQAQHADPSGNCNIVFGHASNTVFAPATSFAALIYPSEPAGGNWLGVGEGLEIRIVQGGIVQITDRTAPEGSQVSHGSWEYRTVHGQQLMMLTLPGKFTSRLWDVGQPFLTVHNGYVRRGAFLPGGTPETIGELQFNEVAFQDIKDRLTL